MTLNLREREGYHDDRRPELYGCLILFLVINNLVVVLRCIARLRMKDQRNPGMAAEDILVVITGLVVDAIIGNLLAATHFGLGLHTWRILDEDPDSPSNLSNTFKHVWVTMVLTGPVFTLIKLTLLFYYRRLFLINQKWLRIAWWANLIYCFLWLIGATGFYTFQCSPPTWYFKQYFYRYPGEAGWPKGKRIGQCKATTVEHVSLPLIFGLISDVAILCLPVATLWGLKVSTKKRLGLIALFGVGALACVLDMVRIIELRTDTDDQTDPSYGVVIFLILSAACEVVAVTCICLPVIGPWLWRTHKQRTRHANTTTGYGSSGYTGSSNSRYQSKSNRSNNFRELNGWDNDGYLGHSTSSRSYASRGTSSHELETNMDRFPCAITQITHDDERGEGQVKEGEIHVRTEVMVTRFKDDDQTQLQHQ